MRSVNALVRACVALGGDVGDLSDRERALVSEAGDSRPTAHQVEMLEKRIRAGRDPLGDAFTAIKTAEERRPHGQVYTPKSIVKAMMAWSAANGTPARVIDPGVGSARFLAAASEAFPDATLIGADIDPLALLMARANLNTRGVLDRADVRLMDYRALNLEPVDGATLFVGNPPYVRHHHIEAEWKQWLLTTAKRRGLPASGLSGLHAHFFLATAEHARDGDYGVFVTSSEWLDVNYGSLVRSLLLDDLGGVGLHIIEPEAEPFEDTATTAAIASFKVGERAPSMKVKRVKSARSLGALATGKAVKRERLAEANRWSPLTRTGAKLPSDFIELGELCRVHRGAVTGSNATWVARGAVDLPERFLLPSVTKARELFAAGASITDSDALRRIITLPVDLDSIEEEEDRERVDRFISGAKARGVHEGYIASRRRAWWAVDVRDPAPILATYMARRPPTFVMNGADARHINVAHGLYPREAMSMDLLGALAKRLRESVTLAGGRVYAGGLTKFEPKEMERLAVPRPEVLLADV